MPNIRKILETYKDPETGKRYARVEGIAQPLLIHNNDARIRRGRRVIAPMTGKSLKRKKIFVSDLVETN